MTTAQGADPLLEQLAYYRARAAEYDEWWLRQGRYDRGAALNAQWFAEQVRSTLGWCVLAPVPLQTVCVRYEPAGLEGEALDTFTLDWVERVNNSGGAYLTPSVLDGRWMVRVSIGALTTEREHVQALWELMQREAHEE